MIKVNIHEIKDQLSQFIELVENGETIIVCKRDVPVAEFRRIEQKETKTPVLGSAARAGIDGSTFGEPLPEADLRLWEEGDPERCIPEHRARLAVEVLARLPGDRARDGSCHA